MQDHNHPFIASQVTNKSPLVKCFIGGRIFVITILALLHTFTSYLWEVLGDLKASRLHNGVSQNLKIQLWLCNAVFSVGGIKLEIGYKNLQLRGTLSPVYIYATVSKM